LLGGGAGYSAIGFNGKSKKIISSAGLFQVFRKTKIRTFPEHESWFGFSYLPDSMICDYAKHTLQTPKRRDNNFLSDVITCCQIWGGESVTGIS